VETPLTPSKLVKRMSLGFREVGMWWRQSPCDGRKASECRKISQLGAEVDVLRIAMTKKITETSSNNSERSGN